MPPSLVVFAAFAARLRRRCLTHAYTPRKRTFAACPWGRAADCEREIRLAGLRKGGGQFASPSPLVFAVRLQKCLAPERFACLLVLCPALQRANRLFSLRPGSRLSGVVVSPAEVARGTFPRRTGKGAGSVCFALLNVPGRSRCSSTPGSFGWSSVPCSLPQRNWRALRGLRALRRRRTQGHQKRPERLAFRPCLMNGVHRQRCDRNFRSFAPRSGRDICRPGGTSDSRCAHVLRRVPRHPCRSCERADYLMYWFSHLVMVPSALMPAIQSFTALSRSG